MELNMVSYLKAKYENENALDILNKKYAKGQLSKEELRNA
jgi:uncharacterized membrane protein